MPFAATRINLEIIMLSEVNQKGKRQISCITYTWNLKRMIPMNFFTRQTQTHRLRKQTYCYQQGRVEGRDS